MASRHCHLAAVSETVQQDLKGASTLPDLQEISTILRGDGQFFLHAAGSLAFSASSSAIEMAHAMLPALLHMSTMLAEFTDEMTPTMDTMLPPVGERVIVQCEGFLCVGICDVNGRWLDAYNHQPLPNVIGFRPLGSR
jgi:hypothetical protein